LDSSRSLVSHTRDPGSQQKALTTNKKTGKVSPAQEQYRHISEMVQQSLKNDTSSSTSVRHPFETELQKVIRQDLKINRLTQNQVLETKRSNPTQ